MRTQTSTSKIRIFLSTLPECYLLRPLYPLGGAKATAIGGLVRNQSLCSVHILSDRFPFKCRYYLYTENIPTVLTHVTQQFTYSCISNLLLSANSPLTHPAQEIIPVTSVVTRMFLLKQLSRSTDQNYTKKVTLKQTVFR